MTRARDLSAKSLLEIVQTDMLQNHPKEALSWEQYAAEMYADRFDMYADFPHYMTFIQFRALCREAAGVLL